MDILGRFAHLDVAEEKVDGKIVPTESIVFPRYHQLDAVRKLQRVFDSVVVVTDRRVLDQQLQNTIYQFEHKQGVVQKIDENSQQLADALSSGTPIVITTLQKFPFVTEKIGKLPNRRYDVTTQDERKGDHHIRYCHSPHS